MTIRRRGRPPESLSKKTLVALRALADRKCNVVEFLAAVVQKDHVYLRMAENHITLDHRIAAGKALMPFITPQLKAIEVTDNSPQPMVVNLIQLTKSPETKPNVINGDAVEVSQAAPPALQFKVPIPQKPPKKWVGRKTTAATNPD